MQTVEYAIFRTKWGYFALAGQEGVVHRASLPLADHREAQHELLRGVQIESWDLRLNEDFASDLQRRIIAYFEGEPVDFSDEKAISLSCLGPFDRKVLETCRRIGFGRTTTYGELAGRIGHPGAARAVGSALARNPIPLIVPCHRVLRTDGSLGGFSAPGGTATKLRLLRHEQLPAMASA